MRGEWGRLGESTGGARGATGRLRVVGTMDADLAKGQGDVIETLFRTKTRIAEKFRKVVTTGDQGQGLEGDDRGGVLIIVFFTKINRAI